MLFRHILAIGRTTTVLKKRIEISSRKISRKHHEQHSIKRLVIGSSVNRYWHHYNICIYHCISTRLDCFGKTEKRFMGVKK